MKYGKPVSLLGVTYSVQRTDSLDNVSAFVIGRTIVVAASSDDEALEIAERAVAALPSDGAAMGSSTSARLALACLAVCQVCTDAAAVYLSASP